MSEGIIRLADYRNAAQAVGPGGLIFTVEIQLLPDGTLDQFVVRGAGAETPAAMRVVSDALGRSAEMLRAEANDRQPAADENLLATIRVFESSRVNTSWTTGAFDRREDCDWLRRRLDQAMEPLENGLESRNG